MNVKDLNIPEIRRMLAAQGFPSDLITASKIRKAARRGALQWTAERILTTDESCLILRPEKKP